MLGTVTIARAFLGSDARKSGTIRSVVIKHNSKRRIVQHPKLASFFYYCTRYRPHSFLSSKMSESSLPFHGELMCAREACPNHAYFQLNGKYWCGVHSKRDAATRRPLPKDPQGSAKRQKLLQTHKELALIVPTDAPRPGKVACYRMLMMRQVPLEGRWLNIMPNRKAVSRTDGIGMNALSPMLLGPVDHRQPGLPAARNIENYHQGNKVTLL